MYNISENMNNKQSIINKINIMNYFDEDSSSEEEINRFNISLYNQLNNNFPYLMKTIKIEDMDYLIEKFNLNNKNKNIKLLLQFLKKRNDDYYKNLNEYIYNKSNYNEQFSDSDYEDSNYEIQQNKYENSDYDEINNAINFFNKISDDDSEENETNTYNSENYNKSKYNSNYNNNYNNNFNSSNTKNFNSNNTKNLVIDEKPSMNENKNNINIDELLKKRELEHQQLLNEFNNNPSNLLKNNNNKINEINNEKNIVSEDKQNNEINEINVINEINENDLYKSNILENKNENLNINIEKKMLNESNYDRHNINNYTLNTNQNLKTLEKQFVITINSNDRDKSIYPNCNDFSIKLIDNNINNIKNSKFSNIISIELDNIIVPKFSNVEGNLDNYPYLLLEIKELGGNYSGTNKFINQTFSKLIFEKTFGKYKSITNKTKKTFYPPITIDKLSFQFRKPNGDLYNFGNNIIDIENDEKESQFNQKSNELVLYNEKQINKRIIEPVITLDFSIKYLAKEISTHYTI